MQYQATLFDVQDSQEQPRRMRRNQYEIKTINLSNSIRVNILL